MDIVYISNQVKFDVLSVSGQSAARAYNLMTNTPLYSIGYENNDELCRALEFKLRLIAEEYQTGKSINPGAVSKDLTVRQCIQLVIV
jgi:hypothetical protein